MFGLKPKFILLVLVIAAIGYVAAQYVPAYVTDFQLRDFVRQEVRFAAPARRTPEDVRRIVLEQAHEWGIDLTAKDIQLTRKGVLFSLEFDYEWPINLRLWDHTLHFSVSATGELFDSGRR
jgi:hypothetical protein